MLAARGQRHPWLNQRNFWTLDFQVNLDVLAPRADTETLVEWDLELQLPTRASVIDLCTGSACIVAALASERPEWQFAATEISPQAFQLAKNNLSELGYIDRVQLSQGDLTHLEGPYDLVVANPPYIDPSEAETLDPEVSKYEPKIALFAEEQGLRVIRRIAAESPAKSSAGAWLLMEHSHRQGAAVRDLLERSGYQEVSTRKDLGHRERVTGGRRP